MGQIEAFQASNCRCWMYTGDHDAPHFHAGEPDAWEVRVYFLEDPIRVDVKFSIRRVPGRTMRELKQLAEDHRAELLDQWTRSMADE